MRSLPRPTVSICLPARDEVATVGAIVQTCVALREDGVVDQVVVVDDSTDGTARIAAAAGATVYAQRVLRPEFGPVLGKGDAMWRALSVLEGDLVVFLDADSSDVTPEFVTGLLAPLLASPTVQLVKGHYRRPLRLGGVELPTGGGRVTELTARPLLRRCFPELAAIRQPLAGEIGARRELLHALPFDPGYGVDVGLLIDTFRRAGRSAIAEADLGVRHNAHQSLEALHRMACAVGDAILDRAAGLQTADARPPLRQSRTPEDAAAA